MKIVKAIPLEALLWLSGLVALAFADPSAEHVVLCPLALMEFDFCPGCGLGRSIAYLFHGEIVKSFQSHPLGVFAVLVLLNRIYTLVRRKNIYIHHGKSN
jgi:hypothetical protein